MVQEQEGVSMEDSEATNSAQSVRIDVLSLLCQH